MLLYISTSKSTYIFLFRGVAQLVERVVWDHEVARSIRVAPTKALKIAKFETSLFFISSIYHFFITHELLKNNLPPIVISKNDRVKYFEFLRNNNINGFASWLKELSNAEEERMKKFWYKK